MKKVISTSLLAAAIGIVGCQQPTTSTGSADPFVDGTQSTPAHPAIVYNATVVSHGTTYATIGVMDSDASHQTTIVTASSSSDVYGSACWSPTAGSIAYSDAVASSGNWAIKAIDISVNSKGVPVASNTRTIFSLTATDSATLGMPSWCSVSTTGKLSFVRAHQGSKLGLSELCTVAQTGGAATVLASVSGLTASGVVVKHFATPTWSPDDSKIAVIRRDTNILPNGTTTISTILIVDGSTGAVVDSIPSTMALTNLEWSRSGANELVFTGSTGSSDPYKIYYCAATTGASIAGNGVAIINGPSWSPTNSSLMASISGVGIVKVSAYSSTYTTLATSGGGSGLKWKR